MHAGLWITGGLLGGPYYGCSTSFSARRESQYGILTAGHCGWLLSSWQQGGRHLGTMIYRNYGPDDEGFILTARRRVSTRVYETAVRNRVVTRVESRRAEHRMQEVCTSGATSNTVVCGRLLRVHHNLVNSQTGITLRDQRKASIIALPGDSGGPVYRRVGLTGAIASGIISQSLLVKYRIGGGYAYAPIAMTYQHVRTAQQRFGLRVLTRR